MGAMWKDKPRSHALVALGTCWERSFVFIKPLTFMNASGEFLKPLLAYHKCAAKEMIVIHDDVAFPPGHLKLSRNCGDGGHNGVKDVTRVVGPDFVRFRLGVGAKRDGRMDLADHVLGRLAPEELGELERNSDFFWDSLRLTVDKGCTHAMNAVNQRKKARNTNDEQT